MKSNILLLTVALFILGLSSAVSQSLSELAEKERERRSEIQDYRVITDEEAASYRSGSDIDEGVSLHEADGNNENGESEEGTTADTTKPEQDEPVDFEGRPESFWRQTMTEARQKVRELENEANVLILRINQLQDQFYKQSDGFYRETIQRELQKSYYEQDLNKENLARAKASLDDLENEARKSGALPGWIENRR